MRPVPIVSVKPDGQLGGSLAGVCIGPGVGPFAQRGLDEAFRLSVGPGCVGCAYPQIESDSPKGRHLAMFCGMVDILRLIWSAIADFFRSRADLQTEIIVLRHQPVPLLGALHHHRDRI